MRIFAIISGFVAALFVFPNVAFALVADPLGYIDFVISGTPLRSSLPVPDFDCTTVAGIGACNLAELFVYVVRQGRLIIGAIAFLILAISGFTLIVRQSEESLTAAKNAVIGVVVGVFLVFLSEQFVDALYGGFSIPAGEVFLDPANMEEGALILSGELLGIIRWAETLVAIAAVGLIVVQAAYVLASFGSEETIRKAYRAVFSTIIGILLIVFDRSIAAIFGYDQIAALPGAPDASIFVVEVFGFIRLLLGFVGIVAVAILVYAGVLMIVHYGNDEMITKAKTVLINAAIGLVLIVVSFVIVQTVVLGIV